MYILVCALERFVSISTNGRAMDCNEKMLFQISFLELKVEPKFLGSCLLNPEISRCRV